METFWKELTWVKKYCNELTCIKDFISLISYSEDVNIAETFNISHTEIDWDANKNRS